MQISIAGGAWILGSSYGTLSSEGRRDLPDIEKLFTRIPARFGRFDDFTRFGFAAVGLALMEAGWTESSKSEDTGLVLSTQYGVMQTDLSYYATTIEQDALLSSPNLFSYTLPVTVIGECAIFFHLTGPTFCIGDDGRSGMKALETALLLLRGNQARRIIAVWIETPPELWNSQAKQSGAVALVLEMETDGAGKRRLVSSDQKCNSLFALFSYLDLSYNR